MNTIRPQNIRETVGKGRVLVVDDQEPIRAALTRMLQREGFVVCVAEEGATARNMIETDPSISLVISDVEMPFMDGYDLSLWIKRNRPQLPVVLVSGCDFTEDLLDGYAAGAQYYLTKPFDRFGVMSVVKHLTGHTDRVPPHEIERRVC